MSSGQILLVDDDVRITRMIRRVAERSGFSVTEVNDSRTFAQVYEKTPASLIILDLNMPGKDGIELLNYLVEAKSTARVMFVSGVDRRVLGTTAKLAASRGVDVACALQKPVDVVELSRALDSHARGHGLPTIEDLDAALAQGQISVAYQPKIELITGKVIGAEALARWEHLAMGPISPEHFVSMAENSDRIEALTETVLSQAIRAAKGWQQSFPGVEVAINLSPQLLMDLTLPDRFRKVTRAVGLEPSNIKLEITERGAMADIENSMAILSRLRLKGAGLSIDDFGTGSSSLVHLYRMPFGEMKIDKSFVLDMGEQREAEVIVNSIIQLGKSMGLNVVAEGVETLETLERLKALGCRHGQGFLFSRPLPEAEFLEWLKRNEGLWTAP